MRFDKFLSFATIEGTVHLPATRVNCGSDQHLRRTDIPGQRFKRRDPGALTRKSGDKALDRGQAHAQTRERTRSARGDEQIHVIQLEREKAKHELDRGEKTLRMLY